MSPLTRAALPDRRRGWRAARYASDSYLQLHSPRLGHPLPHARWAAGTCTGTFAPQSIGLHSAGLYCTPTNYGSHFVAMGWPWLVQVVRVVTRYLLGTATYFPPPPSSPASLHLYSTTAALQPMRIPDDEARHASISVANP